MQTPKKVGRPVKEATPGQRVSLGLKVTAEIKSLIDAEAKASGRTQSQEVEHRLEKSFEREGLLPEVLELAYGRQLAGLLMAVGWAMSDTGRFSGFQKHRTLEAAEQWADDPYAYDQAVKAAAAILAAAKPEGEPTPPEYQDALLADIASNFGQITGRTIAEVLGNKATEATLRQGEQAKPIRALLGPIVKRLKRSRETTPTK